MYVDFLLLTVTVLIVFIFKSFFLMKNYEAHRLEERHDANIPVDNFSSSSQIKYEKQMNFRSQHINKVKNVFAVFSHRSRFTW